MAKKGGKMSKADFHKTVKIYKPAGFNSRLQDA